MATDCSFERIQKLFPHPDPETTRLETAIVSEC